MERLVADLPPPPTLAEAADLLADTESVSGAGSARHTGMRQLLAHWWASAPGNRARKMCVRGAGWPIGSRAGASCMLCMHVPSGHPWRGQLIAYTGRTQRCVPGCSLPPPRSGHCWTAQRGQEQPAQCTCWSGEVPTARDRRLLLPNNLLLTEHGAAGSVCSTSLTGRLRAPLPRCRSVPLSATWQAPRGTRLTRVRAAAEAHHSWNSAPGWPMLFPPSIRCPRHRKLGCPPKLCWRDAPLWVVSPCTRALSGQHAPCATPPPQTSP